MGAVGMRWEYTHLVIPGGNFKSSLYLQACFWVVGGNWRTWWKLTWTRREHAQNLHSDIVFGDVSASCCCLASYFHRGIFHWIKCLNQHMNSIYSCYPKANVHPCSLFVRDESASATFYYKQKSETNQNHHAPRETFRPMSDNLVEQWMYYRSLKTGESELLLRNKQVRDFPHYC